MPQLVLDAFDAIGPWAALDAGLAASGALALAVLPEGHPFAAIPVAMHVEIGAGAAGHRVRRDFGATDLGGFDRLTLWHRTDVRLGGAAGDPLRLRLRLGSVAVPLDAAGNLWHRYLLAETAEGWSYAVLSLADLPAAIRGAVSQIEIVVAETDGAPHRLMLDALAACTPRMTVDVDAGLMAQLDGGLQIGGNRVPARIEPAPPTVPPRLRISLFASEALMNDRRALTASLRRDASDAGMLLWPAPEPWDLTYRVEFAAATRPEQAAMLDFVTTRLGGRGWLPVGNRAFRIEQVPFDIPDEVPQVAPVLCYRVAAWREGGAPVAALPVTELRIATDLTAGGP